MRDVDDPDTLGLQLAHGGKQRFDLVGGQTGGRFVEHQETAGGCQHAGDRDQRFLGTRKARDAGLRIDVAADLGKSDHGPPIGFGPVDRPQPAATAARIAIGDGDVLRDRHPLDEAEILMDEGDGLGLSRPTLGFVEIIRSVQP